jgi:hypothetical protein
MGQKSGPRVLRLAYGAGVAAHNCMRARQTVLQCALAVASSNSAAVRPSSQASLPYAARCGVPVYHGFNGRGGFGVGPARRLTVLTVRPRNPAVGRGGRGLRRWRAARVRRGWAMNRCDLCARDPIGSSYSAHAGPETQATRAGRRPRLYQHVGGPGSPGNPGSFWLIHLYRFSHTQLLFFFF